MIDYAQVVGNEECGTSTGRSWKVALVHPSNWPHVRRGTERFLNEFALYLGRQGHRVRIICSTPDTPGTVQAPGYTVDYHRRLWREWMGRVGVHEYHVFPLTAFASLLREQFDIIHCFNFTDAIAASAAVRFRPAKVVLHLASIPPTVSYRRTVRAGGLLLRRAIWAADEVLTVGTTQREYFEGRFGRQCVTTPVPVDTDLFALAPPRDAKHPVILCASALEDRRKGGRLLMRAFQRVKRVHPDAELQISSHVSERLRQTLLALVEPKWRGDVRFLGAGDLADLPELFGAASVLVLPSLWEAFSMVQVEALATGTPVVATTSKPGYHELIHDSIGRTFEPGDPDQAEPSNLEGLVVALLEALELSRDPATGPRCREAAMQFSWPVVGPLYEDVYRKVLEQ